jgi:uncharacterized protein (TIGR03086 family)
MATPTPESLNALSRALDQAADVLAGVREDQLGLPTPCPEWDVSAVVSHLLQDVERFTQGVTGGTPDWTRQPEALTGDWVAAFRMAAADLMSAWRQGGESDAGPDWQTPEIALHTWDLVRATGQDRDLDPVIAERSLEFMKQGLTPDNRGQMFASEVSVPDDAPAYERLAAFAGRDPA